MFWTCALTWIMLFISLCTLHHFAVCPHDWLMAINTTPCLFFIPHLSASGWSKRRESGAWVQSVPCGMSDWGSRIAECHATPWETSPAGVPESLPAHKPGTHCTREPVSHPVGPCADTSRDGFALRATVTSPRLPSFVIPCPSLWLLLQEGACSLSDFIFTLRATKDINLLKKHCWKNISVCSCLLWLDSCWSFAAEMWNS